MPPKPEPLTREYSYKYGVPQTPNHLSCLCATGSNNR